MVILFMTATLAFTSFLIGIPDLADRGSVNMTLLLTVVAFKLLLSDNLPKVAYLTYLDKYVLTSFIFIFVIAIENALVAFMVGIPDTPTCSPENSNATTEDKDCEPPTDTFCAKSFESDWWSFQDENFLTCSWIFRKSSSWTIDEAIGFERWFFLISVVGWTLFQLRSAWLAWGFISRNSKDYGRHVDATKDKDDDELPDWDDGNAIDWNVVQNKQKQNELGSLALGANSREHDKRWKDVLSLPKKRKDAKQKNGGPAAVSTDPSKSFEYKELLAAISNAGLGMELVSLIPRLIEKGLNVDRIKTLEPVLTSKLLKQLNIKLEDRLNIIMSAKQQVKTLFLQGTASYMMIVLGLDEKLVTKQEVITKIMEQFTREEDVYF
jgi:hypothetical protein